MKKKFEHYLMCGQCAEDRGGKFPTGHVCTVLKGTCKYCETDNQILIPWVDFNWPQEKEIDTLAKSARD